VFVRAGLVESVFGEDRMHNVDLQPLRRIKGPDDDVGKLLLRAGESVKANFPHLPRLVAGFIEGPISPRFMKLADFIVHVVRRLLDERMLGLALRVKSLVDGVPVD
jgi:hypothetical protein